jgi:enoyl-CoA hydratase
MLHVERNNGIVWLTMDRPPANALNNHTLRELVGTLEELKQDDSVRGVVVTGAGNRFFTAGGDVKEFSSITQDQGLERVRLGSRLKASLGALECPLVCAVNGAAIGSGMEMAALADFCIASDTARFGMPEINHGLLPMAKGIQQLVKVIGLNNTKELLFSGEIFGASKAKEIGLVHEIVAPDELRSRAHEWITVMASKPPELFRALKRTVIKSMYLSDDELEHMTELDFLTYFRAEEPTASLNSFIGDSQARATVRGG